MLKVYPPDPITGKSAFVRARVIGDYNYAFKKCRQLKSLMDHLEFVRNDNEQTGKKRMIRVRQGFKCWCCGVLKDEEAIYVNKIIDLKKVIRAEVSR